MACIFGPVYAVTVTCTVRARGGTCTRSKDIYGWVSLYQDGGIGDMLHAGLLRNPTSYTTYKAHVAAAQAALTLFSASVSPQKKRSVLRLPRPIARRVSTSRGLILHSVCLRVPCLNIYPCGPFDLKANQDVDAQWTYFTACR